MSDTIKITQGQIWEVVTDIFYGSKTIQGYPRDSKFHIKKGEKIEIRYPYEWHYRTEDNMYMQSSSDYINQNCKIFGVVNPDVKSANKALLEEILRLELYTPCQ